MSDRTNAREYFRSLEQMAGSEEAVQRLEQEFPGYDPKQMASMPRRNFLKLMGASMAVAGVTLTGCRRWPKEHLVPSTAGLRDQMPGVPEFYATAVERNGVADSILVTSYDGRPIKIEGNPLHPLYTSWRKADGTPLVGASDPFAQASVLDLYDPIRSRGVLEVVGGQPTPKKWEDFFAAFEAAAGNGGGAGLAVLCEASSSLTVSGLRTRFIKKFPQAIWADYEPLGRDAEVAAGQVAFQRSVRAIYNLASARTIVSLDGDLLGTHPNKIRHASDWAANRKSADGSGKTMNRLYLAESGFSITGSVADHRLPIKPSALPSIALALAAKLGVAGVAAPNDLPDAQRKWVDAAAADLKAAGKNGVVAVGLHALKEVQALVYAINYALGAVGTTLTFHEMGAQASQVDSLRTLTQRMNDGQVSALLIIGGNPVYDAPADLEFGGRLESVKLRAHLSPTADETSRKCNWLLPRSHYLEAWGDARAWDGSVLLQQPLIMPLYDTKSSIEVLATILKESVTDGQTLVRRMISASLPGAADDAGWQRSLHDGFVADSAFPVAALNAPQSIAALATMGTDGFELRFLQSTHTYDGRYANNAWLVECPDNITKLCWDNAALLNKTDADKLGVGLGDMIEIKLGNSLALELPVYILWGQPQGVIGLPLGFGRTAAGPIGGDPQDEFATQPIGFDTYKLRRSDGMYAAFNNVSIRATGNSYDLVTTQEYQDIDWAGWKGYVDRIGLKGESGRVVRDTSLTNYAAHPNFVDTVVERFPLQQLWDAPYGKDTGDDKNAPQAFNNPHAWGMAIDMSTCIGCNACVVACQSENNIPTVGKAMVKMNRAMEWIRIDRYFKPQMNEKRDVLDYENIDVVYQPMMCVHCETAPCEQVCPVAATVHDTEGLNTMVYNRCIGTRYCANNCPYKVRRFNYMDWHSRNPRTGNGLGLLGSAWLGIPDTQQNETLKQVHRLVYNPEVTVRMRGVMEKCTYCTQRIKAKTIVRKNEWAKGNIPHEAKANGQPNYTVDDFEVITACQQACPTQAITFGNLLDKTSTVRSLHALPRSYAVLEDLNTRPRTRHLAKIRNPNETLAGGVPAVTKSEHA